MRFSLKWLLISVAFVAFSLGALLNANELWIGGFRSVVLFTVLIAIAGVVWSVGQERAFCGGYALFALSFFTTFFGFQWGSGLISTNGLSALHNQLFASTTERVSKSFDFDAVEGDLQGASLQPDGTVLVTYIRPKRDHFVPVGHCVLSIIFGMVGGLIAKGFYRRSRKPVS